MAVKKLSTLILCIFYILNGVSQNTLTKVGSFNPKNHLQVYRNAVSCGDYTTAIVALNYVVVESKNGQYSDSLAYLYYFSNNYYQSIYWCTEALKHKVNDIGLLELKAMCLKQTKQIFKAIEIYEQLVNISPSPVFAFNLIELQYMAKRLYECLITTNTVETLSFKNDMIYSYKVDENRTYSTPLKAAFYNYKGLVFFELKDSQQAKIAFEMALSIDSNFLLAKNNLNAVSNGGNSGNRNSSNNIPPDNKEIPLIPAESEPKQKY